MTLAELTAGAPRVALVGLAKNTGKTVALAALLAECGAAGRTVGATSIGRDGEAHDVIDFRIEKPPVRLDAGALVATTDELLRASGVPHELVERTGMRTPLGEVLIARLRGAGTIEVAGPSAAADARRVADAMLAAGAEQVLIDGAIDRRAASSPEVSDGLLMSTGAVLSEEIEEVVQRTADAVELVRLPGLGDGTPEERRLRELLDAHPEQNMLLGEDLEVAPLAPRFVLTAEGPAIAELFRNVVEPRWLIVSGAVPEAFLQQLIAPVRRGRRPLKVLAQDPTRVFLSGRGPEFYARAGIELLVRRPIGLLALTVNPVAPQSHAFDSARLRAMLAEKVAGVPIFDVMHPSYAGAPPQMARRAGRMPLPGAAS
ncbi:MAG TPA: hypothetical protein VN618_15035 [Solirubrobacteraceae bacterium]|nr:hypothetical protein [Solirubrobacteraceae bacterium]